MDNKLDKINLKCDTTVNKVDERFDRIEMMFNKMWGSDDKHTESNHPNMDYHLTRDELLLKRKVQPSGVQKNDTEKSQQENQELTLLATQEPEEYCDGNAAKVRK
jgi:hypothetical protein